jgi:hypothetical protein
MLNRLKEYIDYKKISISAFEKSIGMSNASFGKSLKNGGTIGCDKLEKILSIYPDLNLLWLVTGQGEMLVNLNSSSQFLSSSPDLMLLIKEKDREIMAKSEEIGRLKEQVEMLKKESIKAYPSVAKAKH